MNATKRFSALFYARAIAVVAVAAVFLCNSSCAFACISIAVATEKTNGVSNVVSWQISQNTKIAKQRVCEKKAEDTLEEILEYHDETYDELHSQTGGPEQGHTLKGGYWVVVSSSRSVKGGEKNSYGLGASSESLKDAEKKALLNLSKYDPEWNKNKDKYKVEDKGHF